MGREIQSEHFQKRDFIAFEKALLAETALLKQWFFEESFADSELVIGFELEAWLIDSQGRPAPFNASFLEHLNDPLVVPELSCFNVEINGTPQVLKAGALSRLYEELEATWQRCQQMAKIKNLRLAMIGIPPTVREDDLVLENISAMKRYHALNEQVIRMREGMPLSFDIRKDEHWTAVHSDIMIESAATSLQIHLQVPQQEAVQYFNAAVMLSAPMVAASANSPWLFGHSLWDESRIPLFEQAVSVPNPKHDRDCARVGFGTNYPQHSLFEFFAENCDDYPVLLPMQLDEKQENLPHLRLHNGTIWRWNRPLVGFDDAGKPHLRIEHRVASAGPTILDVMANVVLFLGMIQGLVKHAEPILLPFAQARDNFYRAAKDGLNARLGWNNREVSVQELLLKELLPLAHIALEQMPLEPQDWQHWLGIMEGRLQSGRNGATWQKMWVERHGRKMAELMIAYLEQQESGIPVHEWNLH